MSKRSRSLDGLLDILRAEGLLVASNGAEGVSVSGVSQDSRTLSSGDLFLAWKGVDHDAHRFLADAFRGGCAAAVVESVSGDVSLPQIQVRDGRRAAAIAADWFVGSPWNELFMAGVTGTNGKTTTALLARHLLGHSASAAAIGTLGLVGADGVIVEGTEGLTTPGPVQLSEMLGSLSDAGVTSVVMEASSHALDQRRLDGVRFDVAAFTNFGEDHLDYHRSSHEYLRAKSRLLELLRPGGVALVNADERAWDDLDATTHARMTFGMGSEADLRAEAIRFGIGGSRFRISHRDRSSEVALPLLGGYNVSNALAAGGIALISGLSLDDVAERLGRAPQIPGRLEIVVSDPFSVLIDFAHTPDALENVLSTVQPLVSGRLIVVFGAGGDRDRGKRPRMARAVARFADLAVVTSDNPRCEDPESIVDEILVGIGSVDYRRIVSRRDAIGYALSEARPGDLILLAGKGHETYQVVGTEKRPFDERRIVREALAAAEGS